MTIRRTNFVRLFPQAILIFLVLGLSTECLADSYLRKVTKHKAEFRSMADYVLKKYNNEGFSRYIIITVDTVKDEEIIRFCKKFDIKNIYVYDDRSSESKYLIRTVSFFKRYTPLVGKKREVTIDYKNDEQRWKFPYPKSIKKIDQDIYYSKY